MQTFHSNNSPNNFISLSATKALCKINKYWKYSTIFFHLSYCQKLTTLSGLRPNGQKIMIDNKTLSLITDTIQDILYYATTSLPASFRDRETGTDLSRWLHLTGTWRRGLWRPEMWTSIKFLRSSMVSMTLIKGCFEFLVYLLKPGLLIINFT